jgi:hypothetical protein
LGIREDTGGNQVRTYRRWLRDTKEYSDKKIEELVNEKFCIPIIEDPKDSTPIREEIKHQPIYEIGEELIKKYKLNESSNQTRKQGESEYNTVREHADPKVKHTKKDHKKSKHKHKSHRHKSKYLVT